MDSEDSLDWLQTEPTAVVLRVRMQDQPPRTRVFQAEELQRVMDKAARDFADSSRPSTPPIPDSLLRDLLSQTKSSPPTPGRTGLRKRAR